MVILKIFAPPGRATPPHREIRSKMTKTRGGSSRNAADMPDPIEFSEPQLFFTLVLRGDVFWRFLTIIPKRSAQK